MFNDLIKSLKTFEKMQEDWPYVKRFMDDYKKLNDLKVISNEEEEDCNKILIEHLVYNIFSNNKKRMNLYEIQTTFKREYCYNNISEKEKNAFDISVKNILECLIKKDKISVDKINMTYSLTLF